MRFSGKCPARLHARFTEKTPVSSGGKGLLQASLPALTAPLDATAGFGGASLPGTQQGAACPSPPATASLQRSSLPSPSGGSGGQRPWSSPGEPGFQASSPSPRRGPAVFVLRLIPSQMQTLCWGEAEVQRGEAGVSLAQLLGDGAGFSNPRPQIQLPLPPCEQSARRAHGSGLRGGSRGPGPGSVSALGTGRQGWHARRARVGTGAGGGVLPPCRPPPRPAAPPAASSAASARGHPPRAPGPRSPLQRGENPPRSPGCSVSASPSLSEKEGE